MKPFTLRTIMPVAVSVLFAGFAMPFALRADSIRDAYAAVLGGMMFASFVGLPLFAAIKWTQVRSQQERGDDPVTLDRRYRNIDCYLSCAGMLSLGYMTGWFAAFGSVSEIQFIISVALLLTSMLVTMVVAIAKTRVDISIKQSGSRVRET